VKTNIFRKTVRAPAFINVAAAGEVFKHRLREMNRFLMTAKPPVRIPGSKESTATTLKSILIELETFWMSGPVFSILLRRFLVREFIDHKLVSIHGILAGGF